MGHKAILHKIKTVFAVVLLGAFWLSSSVVFAKNHSENSVSHASAISISFAVTNISCNGGSNGSITATPSGGVAPYTFQWSNGNTLATITGLSVGTFTVIVTDATGAQATDSKNVSQPDLFGVGAAQINGQICQFAADGKAEAFAYGGTIPYSFAWSNGQSGITVSNLAFGTYAVTATDSKGCTAVSSISIQDNTAEGIWIAVDNDKICPGQLGFLHAGAMSGTPLYSYLWSNGATTEDISGLTAGTYSVTISDASGCSGVKSAQVIQLPGVIASGSSNAAACGQNNGSATVTASGGTGSYTISWSNGGAGSTISGLSAGIYNATVTDTEGCSATASVNVIGGSGTSLVLAATVISQAGCTSGGSATVTVTGGTAPYSYKWDNNQTTQTATGLAAGNRSVTVTDANLCAANTTVAIFQTGAPTLSATATGAATCTAGGTAGVNAFNGTAPYTYLWDNGQTTANATNLSAGIHIVTVSDAAGCSVTASVTIQGALGGPSVSIAVVSQATCTTGGSATATASAGTAPYSYLWDNTQTTATATGLSAGAHVVIVTDAGGCTATGSVIITSTNGPAAAATVVTNATCLIGGSATASASGGTTPYAYKWDNLQTTATATNLSAGPHLVTVTDANGCTATAAVTILNSGSAVLVATTVVSNAICDAGGNASAVASAGTAPYSYKWTNGQATANLTNVASGIYTVTATDANGCTATKTVSISNTPGAKIGDFVWYDADQNGFQEPAETTGAAGISVKLQTAGADGNFGTADDVTVKTVSTNAAGNYLFDCVAPGTYILNFMGLPPGYQWTKKNGSNNDCKDSDVNPNGRTDAFSVTAGQADNLCFDAGIHTVCDQLISPGAVCCDQTICESETPAQLVNNLLPFGGSGAIEYQWLQLVAIGGAPASWIAVPGATLINYQPGPLYQSTSFMRCARRAGCSAFLESNIVSITVKSLGSPGCPTAYVSVSGAAVGNAVQVDWVTMPEFITLTYTVEHSIDQSDWRTVAAITGKKLQDQMNVYAIMHNAPFAGINYYRVKRINQLGDFTYSDLIEVAMKMQESESIKFSPNPIVGSEKLNIQNLMTFDEAVSIDFMEPSGKTLRTVLIPKNTFSKKEIDVSTFPAGIFFARIRFANGVVKTIRLSRVGE